MWRSYRSTLGAFAMVVVMIWTGAAQGPAATIQTGVVPTGWSELLKAFLAHDVQSKTFVDKLARTAPQPTVRALAAILQQEWDLPPDSETLAHPRAVYVPKLSPEDRQTNGQTFVIKVSVMDDGRVARTAFLKSLRQPRLGRLVDQKMHDALFRPAFRGGRFVAGETVVRYTVEVR